MGLPLRRGSSLGVVVLFIYSSSLHTLGQLMVVQRILEMKSFFSVRFRMAAEPPRSMLIPSTLTDFSGFNFTSEEPLRAFEEIGISIAAGAVCAGQENHGAADLARHCLSTIRPHLNTAEANPGRG